MRSTHRLARVAVAAATLAWPLLLPLEAARANGIGDLYVAAGPAVVEIHVAGGEVVTTVDLPKDVTSLAFSPDGRTLYAASDRSPVEVIDIDTISRVEALTAAGRATAVAQPSGARLAVAVAGAARLALVDPADPEATDIRLPGPADRLAADRRSPVVLAASTAASWVAAIDAATGSVRTVELDGRIVAVLVDRDGESGYVATRAPDAVVRVDLRTLDTRWVATLAVAPIGITSLASGPVIAAGSRIYRVGPNGTREFAKAAQSVLGLAASDDGEVLVAALGDRVVAYDATGAARTEVGLAGREAVAALAPVPKPMPLGPSSAGPAASAAPGATSVAAPATARPGAPPPTATDELPLGPLAPPLAGAALVIGAILALSWTARAAFERRTRR